MKVMIIGGTGAFGAYYAKLLKKNEFEVFISGRDYIQTEQFCKENGFFPAKEEQAGEMDCVIVSVPNKNAIEVIERVSKKMKKGSLLVDFCSVKGLLSSAQKKAAKRGLEVASIHPMHGPRVSSISAYPVPVIQISKGNKLDKILNFFRKEKANVFFTTAKEHDSALAIVQGLTHFTQFVSAQTIKQSGFDLKLTKKFASPNYELFLGLMSRVVTQNPELYSQIQTENKENEKIRKIFLSAAKDVFLASNKGSLFLKKKITEQAKLFSSLDEFILSSDKTVSALKFVENTLIENKGKKVLVENIASKNFHYGTVKEIDSGELVIEEGKELKRIALHKIRLVAEKEMLEWKRNNILEKKLDFSFLVPLEAEKKEIIACFEGIKNTRIIDADEYKSDKLPAGLKSITLKTSIFTDENIEETKESILKRIIGLGYKPR